MRILLTGARGMIGREVPAFLEGHEVLPLDVAEMDITSHSQVSRVFGSFRPEGVIHCAAFTDVDGCEREPERAYAVNGEATARLAEACRRGGAALLYLSTDYVFDGEKDGPYLEDDPPNPLSVYGRSKLAGERALALLERSFIVRTSWVFGRGKNFVATMLRLAESGCVIRVVGDQVGAPTYAVDVARVLAAMIATTRWGVYHVTNSGSTSWFDFARLIFRHARLDVQVEKITSSELGRPAPRPRNSRLADTRLASGGFAPLRPFEEALRDYLAAAAP